MNTPLHEMADVLMLASVTSHAAATLIRHDTADTLIRAITDAVTPRRRRAITPLHIRHTEIERMSLPPLSAISNSVPVITER